MPGPRNRPGPASQPPQAPTYPIGSTGGKGSPVAPKATSAWVRFSGVIGTKLPTSLRQASIFYRNALRTLK